MTQATLIYHMCLREEWQAAQQTGAYGGSSQDRADGFIHFSNAQQLPGSAAKHRRGQSGLVLLTVSVAKVGEGLKWEASRADQLFPHLYGSLPVNAVVRVDDIALGHDGIPVLPDHVEETAKKDA